MPIIGLTTQEEAILEAGRLRLGPKKGEGLRELGYFRADFHEGQGLAAAEFRSKFGDKPTQFDCRLPYTNIQANFDAFYTCYNTSGLIGKSDGHKWLYLRDNKTDELIVSNGIPQRPGKYPTEGPEIPYMPFDKEIPVYSYKNKKGQDTAVFARPTGMLNVYVPGVGGLVIVTHSVHSISRLSKQLADVAAKSRLTNIPITMIPIVVMLRKENVPVTINGKRSTQDHYILNVTIRQDWLDAYDAVIDRIVPGVSATLISQGETVLSLPENVSPAELSEADEETEDEPIDATASDPKPLAGDRFSELCRNLFASLADDRSTKILESYKGDVDKALAWAEKRANSFENEKGLVDHVKANWPNFEGFVSPVVAKCNSEDFDPFAVINGIDLLFQLQRDDPEAFGSMDDDQIVAYILDYQK